MDILEKLENFYKNYKYSKGIIGYSHMNKPIYYMAVRRSPSPIIISQYAIHGREYITTYLALKQINYFLKHGNVGTVYFIPAVNPDGIFKSLYVDELNKANSRGVDLNVNFPARWGTGKLNTKTPSRENYIGAFPFSEKETIALRDFTLKIRPNMTISYHAKGEEIYWKFHQPLKNLERDYQIALSLSKVTGYSLVETPFSAGGYKDWCIEKLHIPAVTIEVGKDSLTHPIKEQYLDDIFKKNKKVFNVLTKILKKD